MGSLIDAKVIGLHRIERLITGLKALGGMARYSLLRQLGELIHQQHTRRVLSEKTSHQVQPGRASSLREA
jgi:hypothetical protein